MICVCWTEYYNFSMLLIFLWWCLLWASTIEAASREACEWEDPSSSDTQDGFTFTVEEYCTRWDCQHSYLKSRNMMYKKYKPTTMKSFTSTYNIRNKHEKTKWIMINTNHRIRGLRSPRLRFALLMTWLLTDWCISQLDVSVLEGITSPSWPSHIERRNSWPMGVYVSCDRPADLLPPAKRADQHFYKEKVHECERIQERQNENRNDHRKVEMMMTSQVKLENEWWSFKRLTKNNMILVIE